MLGVVDIPEKSITIVDAASAPADSAATQAGFTRGTEGVRELLDDALDRTQGQLRYVGEWHSHPPRSGAMPSATDLAQIDWLSALFDMDALPALMLIAAEAEISVIFAREAAVPANDDQESGPCAAGGTGG